MKAHLIDMIDVIASQIAEGECTCKSYTNPTAPTAFHECKRCKLLRQHEEFKKTEPRE